MTTSPNLGGMDPEYPWLRIAHEGPKPYAAFRAYLEMGSERSLAKVARLVDKSEAMMGKWSSAHHWVERTRAFDNYVMGAKTDGAIEWAVSARSETQALADKLRRLLSDRLDDFAAKKLDPTVRWSQAATVLMKMQEHGAPPVADEKVAAELDRVEEMIQRIQGAEETA